MSSSWNRRSAARPVTVVASPEAAGVAALRLMVAVAIPAFIALNLNLGHQTNSGMISAFVLAPLWMPAFVKTPAGPVVLFVGFGFLVSGLVLTWVSVADHEVSSHGVLTAMATFATSIGAIGALFWSCRVLGIHWTVGIYGFVWLFEAVSSPAGFKDNPWKFALSLPITLLVFSLVDRQRFTSAKVLAAVGLGIFSILNDTRSLFAIFGLTAVALGWQRLRSGTVREPSLAAFLAAAVVVGFGAYYTITRLLVSGFLGAGAQARSEAQVKASGSLLLGGRPEWTVTVRLFLERPWGFGFGTVPSSHDFTLGREGFASIHLSSQENYLKNYVFEGTQGLRLHSIVADLWVAAGPLGIALVLVMIWLLLTSLASELARGQATATQIFLTILALWNIGFSPSYSNLHQVILAVAIGMAAQAAGAEAKERRRLAAMEAPEPTASARGSTVRSGSTPARR